MAAATSATVYASTPLVGVDFGAKSSTAAFKTLTTLFMVNGRAATYVKASEAIGSIATIIIGASGSASTDSGSAGWTANVPGGAAAGQYFWARTTAI